MHENPDLDIDAERQNITMKFTHLRDYHAVSLSWFALALLCDPSLRLPCFAIILFFTYPAVPLCSPSLLFPYFILRLPCCALIFFFALTFCARNFLPT